MASAKQVWKAVGAPNTGNEWGRVYCEVLDREGYRSVTWSSGFPRHYGPVYDVPGGAVICPANEIDDGHDV